MFNLDGVQRHDSDCLSQAPTLRAPLRARFLNVLVQQANSGNRPIDLIFEPPGAVPRLRRQYAQLFRDEVTATIAEADAVEATFRHLVD